MKAVTTVIICSPLKGNIGFLLSNPQILGKMKLYSRHFIRSRKRLSNREYKISPVEYRPTRAPQTAISSPIYSVRNIQ